MPTLDIKLKPSRFFILFVTLVLVVTMAIIISLDLNHWVRAVLVAITFRYGFSIMRNHALLTGGTAIFRLSASPEGWLLHDRFRISKATLCPESTVTAWVCVLLFNVAGQKKKRCCLLFRDAISADLYRQLLVYLRTNKAAEIEESQ